MEYNNTLITHPTSLEINENKPYPLFFLEFVNATSVPIATTAIPISPVCNGYSVIPVYEAIDDFDKLKPRIDEYAVVIRSVLVTIIVVHKKATYPTNALMIVILDPFFLVTIRSKNSSGKLTMIN